MAVEPVEHVDMAMCEEDDELLPGSELEESKRSAAAFSSPSRLMTGRHGDKPRAAAAATAGSPLPSTLPRPSLAGNMASLGLGFPTPPAAASASFAAAACRGSPGIAAEDALLPDYDDLEHTAAAAGSSEEEDDGLEESKHGSTRATPALRRSSLLGRSSSSIGMRRQPVAAAAAASADEEEEGAFEDDDDASDTDDGSDDDGDDDDDDDDGDDSQPSARMQVDPENAEAVAAKFLRSKRERNFVSSSARARKKQRLFQLLQPSASAAPASAAEQESKRADCDSDDDAGDGDAGSGIIAAAKKKGRSRGKRLRSGVSLASQAKRARIIPGLFLSPRSAAGRSRLKRRRDAMDDGAPLRKRKADEVTMLRRRYGNLKQSSERTIEMLKHERLKAAGALKSMQAERDSLRHDNGILKKAVAIQHSRAEEKDRLIQQLRTALAGTLRKVAELGQRNKELAMHLSAMGDCREALLDDQPPPDVY
eukprot:PLAT324.2.p1 GENE.PLAT324.2~~PLAT324.2.p1  ORF type:complete len:554 (-),score=253.85 PLAT324.2:219-1658(-)